MDVRIHPTILTTNDAAGITFDANLIFVRGNGDRYVLVRKTGVVAGADNFIGNYFNTDGRKVLIKVTRTINITGQPLLNYQQRVVYAVYENTPSTDLTNVNSNYEQYKLTSGDVGNLQVGSRVST